MKAFLNEWSLSSANDVFANWDKIKAFQELVDELMGRCCLEIIAPRNLWDIPLSGCDLRVMSTNLPSDIHVSVEQWQFMKSIYKKMNPAVEGLPFFSEKEDMSNPSSSIGRAANEQRPAMSFAFDECYATDKIKGWLLVDGDTACEHEVMNVYESKTNNYIYFADISQCRHLDPLLTPLWNIDLVACFLDAVDFVNVDSKQRQSMLITYGKIVAEMNGWRYNREISSINKSSGKLRVVFDSTNFVKYNIAYLSLDMEGPEPAFELCDKQGRHKGEYSWDGKKKEPKDNHGIKVKK